MAEVKIKEIIRSKRRTLTLSVNSDATLTVKAPIFTPLPFINAFINKNQEWIEKRIKEIKLRPQAIKHKYTEGEEFLFLGKNYPLKFGHFPLITIETGILHYPISKSENVRTKLTDWYKKGALEIIKERVEVYAKRTGLKYSSVRITQARSRWGSCSHDNRLRFNWKLVMTPMEILDYVVVHELAHIVHKNHSQSFWMYVRNFIPDSKRRIKWLKENSNRLNI